MEYLGAAVSDWSFFLEQRIATEGILQFREEREAIKKQKIEKIPLKNLPLRINDTYEYDNNKKYFLERLKNGTK